jgi:acyl carrier protein
MSDATELRDRIARLFSDTLHRDVPSAETDLFESGLLDSLGFVDLLVHLEREFGTTIALDDLEVENFRSIEQIAEFVRSRAEAPQAVNAVMFGGPVEVSRSS